MKGANFGSSMVPSNTRAVRSGALLGCCILFALAGSTATAQTGAAAGENASGASDTLERCSKTLGVLRIEEDTGSQWYRYYGPRLGSTAPLLSMMILQSNCFVIVERGTGERSISDETRRSHTTMLGA